MNIGRKGEGVTLTTVILGLFIMALIIGVFMATFLGELDLRVLVRENTAERHVLNLAQVVISSEDLCYDEGHFERGMFEKTKLDTSFTEGSDFINEIGYPESVVILSVKDFEDENKKWTVSMKGPTEDEALMECVKGKADRDSIFDSLIFWDNVNLDECEFEGKYNYATGVRVFPISIKYRDEIHLGGLYVTAIEFFDYEKTISEVSIGNFGVDQSE